MSKEKSIEATEVFSILSATINGANFDDLCDAVHRIVHIAGYHKQSVGEWIDLPDYGNGWFQNGQRIFPKSCSVCGGCISYGPYKFCPNCGAKMKGGAE